MGGRANISYKQNPPKSGAYGPRLTITRRIAAQGTYETKMKIEFSIPKLIYGNNLDELTDDDFDSVIQKLHDRLGEMGVEIWPVDLRNAPVSSIHYSKNIPLLDGTSPSYLIGKLAQSDPKKFLDVTKVEYRNGGLVLKWHANSYEVTFYDKLKDYSASKRSSKRSIENDHAKQMGLFVDLNNRQLFELLRMEIRLGSRAKIRQMLKKFGIFEDLRFKALFSSEISQKVLQHYIDEVERARIFLHDKKDPVDLLAELIMHNPTVKPRTHLQMIGLSTVLKDTGIRELKNMYPQVGDAYWYRLLKDLEMDALPLS